MGKYVCFQRTFTLSKIRRPFSKTLIIRKVDLNTYKVTSPQINMDFNGYLSR
jgi:hypothetical protein